MEKQTKNRHNNEHRSNAKGTFLVIFDRDDQPVQFQIDPEDLEAVKEHQWSVLNCRGIKYAVRKVGKKTIYLHRWFMKAASDQLIDHRDRHTLDCRRQNLRYATFGGNSQNKSKAVSKTGFIGVMQIGKRFAARICVHSQSKHLGHYADPATAAVHRDLSAVVLHGEFACLNFPVLAQFGPFLKSLEGEFGKVAA